MPALRQVTVEGDAFGGGTPLIGNLLDMAKRLPFALQRSTIESTRLAIMTRDDILTTIDDHADELRRLGAIRLSLFGSHARGEASATSDVDLLVELRPKTFDSYMDVKLSLERLLGRKVDLVLAEALKPRLRPTILADAIHAARL